jgi:hypothetical protein
MKLHNQKKDASPLNLIEMIEFCMKRSVLKDEVMQYHF